jgi:hypothetical protein
MGYKKKVFVIIAIICMAVIGFIKKPDKDGSIFIQTGKGILYESWVNTSDSNMHGKTYMIENVDTIFFEYVLLHKTTDGIFYVPVTAGQNDGKPVSFKLTTAKDDNYIFENPAHDFPKRIVYHFVSADSIHAFIDDGGPTKRLDFYYQKVH